MTPGLAQLRREPYRLFFPLGGALLLVAVAPWLGFGLWGGGYRPVFHAVLTIQGFLTAIALGFLFTFLPRKTGGAPPSWLELGAAAALSLGVAAAAWRSSWMVSQLLWLSLMAVLGRFVAARLLRSGAGRGPPPDGALVWVPISILMGMCGAAMTALGGILGPAAPWLHLVGQATLTQGMFTGLCLGLGCVLLPVILHGRPPTAPRPAREGTWALHASATALLWLSFALEARFAPQLAWGTRAAVALGLILFGARALRPPSLPGLHRVLLWISAWMIPLGYVLMALFPARRLMGLHVLFIGGFALMVVAISTHVTLSHGGRGELLARRPWQLWVSGAGLTLAVVFRGAMVWDPASMRVWATLAATSLIFAAATWLQLIAQHLRASQAMGGI